MGIVWEKYDATVTVNEDDENRGRIKVVCAGLLGDEETELPMWVEPVFDWGWFYVPDVGEIVEVEACVGSDEDEVYSQMSIDNLDVRWKNKRYHTNEVPENPDTKATIIHPDFLENYGKRRGFATPHGHVFLFDDDPNNPTVQLTFRKSEHQVAVPILPTDFSRLEFEPDGSFKITLLDTTKLHLQTEGKKLIVEIDGGSSLSIEEKDADTIATIGDGSKSVAIAEALKDYIDSSVKAEFDAHIHPTAMGNSGPPVTPLTGYDDTITSSHVKIPDG